MPLNFPSDALQDLNSLSSSIPWLIFIDINISGDEQYYVRNNEDIEWDGETYLKANFDISAIPSKSTGELPEISINLFNTATLAQDVEENDGYIGTGVTVYFVHKNSISSVARADWPLKFSFNIVNCIIHTQTIEFALGVPSYIKQQFPARMYRKDTCDFLYRGKYCWMKGRTCYSESDECNNTFDNCEAHWIDQDGHSRPDYIPFGGIPTLGRGAYRYG